MSTFAPGSRLGGPRRLWLDPVLLGALLWTVLGTVVFLLAAGQTATQLRVFWAFQTPLDAVLLICSWRVARVATEPARRFWLTLTGAAGLFLLGDAEQTLMTIADPAHLSTTGAAVQTTCLAVGLGAVVVSMLRYRPPGDAAPQGPAFWLDAATVLVAGAVLAWCFVIAPKGLHGSEIAGTLTVAGVAHPL